MWDLKKEILKLYEIKAEYCFGKEPISSVHALKSLKVLLLQLSVKSKTFEKLIQMSIVQVMVA